MWVGWGRLFLFGNPLVRHALFWGGAKVNVPLPSVNRVNRYRVFKPFFQKNQIVTDSIAPDELHKISASRFKARLLSGKMLPDNGSGCLASSILGR